MFLSNKYQAIASSLSATNGVLNTTKFLIIKFSHYRYMGLGFMGKSPALFLFDFEQLYSTILQQDFYI